MTCSQKFAFAKRSNESPSGAFVAPQTRACLGRRSRLIMPPAKRNRAFPTGNALLYISLSYADLIASFSSSAILNNVFAICNSRLLPTNRELHWQGASGCWVSVKQFSKNDTATACQDWLRSTRLGRGSIKSHVRTVKVLGMGLFAFQERIHLWKGVTH